MNKQQAGAAVKQIDARGRHGGDDNQRRQHRRHGVEERDLPCRADDVLIVLQIGPVDQCAVARQGEREKGLPQGVNPGHRVGNVFIHGKHIPVARRRARLKGHVHRQPGKHQKKQRHHNLVDLLNPGTDAGNQNDRHQHQAGYLPKIVPKAGGHLPKLRGEAVHIRRRQRLAGKGPYGVL